MNSLFPLYAKMYFNKVGRGNFYGLSSENTKLRGIIVMKSKIDASKKVESAEWSSLSAVEIDLSDKNVATVSINHNLELKFEAESKYFGNVNYDITVSEKFTKSYEEKLSYPDKERYKIYVKYIGRAFEEVETKVLEDNIHVHHFRVSKALNKCRNLRDSNSYNAQKKKLVNDFFN